MHDKERSIVVNDQRSPGSSMVLGIIGGPFGIVNKPGKIVQDGKTAIGIASVQ